MQLTPELLDKMLRKAVEQVNAENKYPEEPPLVMPSDLTLHQASQQEPPRPE